MSPLRLAYATQYLIALIVMLLLWSQVGGPDHFDLTPWYFKLVLTAGAAFAIVKATAAAVSRESAWNLGTVRWLGVLVVILIACGMVTLWVHRNLEDDPSGQEDTSTASFLISPVHGDRRGVRTHARRIATRGDAWRRTSESAGVPRASRGVGMRRA
jgi:hypothetical protein